MIPLLSPDDALSSIQRLDQGVLAVLREGWLDAAPENKPKWMDRINTALDERLNLMRLRDGLTPEIV